MGRTKLSSHGEQLFVSFPVAADFRQASQHASRNRRSGKFQVQALAREPLKSLMGKNSMEHEIEAPANPEHERLQRPVAQAPNAPQSKDRKQPEGHFQWLVEDHIHEEAQQFQLPVHIIGGLIPIQATRMVSGSSRVEGCPLHPQVTEVAPEVSGGLHAWLHAASGHQPVPQVMWINHGDQFDLLDVVAKLCSDRDWNPVYGHLQD